MLKRNYLLLTFLLISQATSKLEMKNEEFQHIRCGGRSVKTSNLCAHIEHEAIEGSRPSKTEFLYVYNKCGEEEQCMSNDKNPDNLDYECQVRTFIRREHGESCVYDRDCYSLSCKDKKCEAIADGTECKEHFQCKHGSYCSAADRKCKQRVQKDKECQRTDECRLGLSCFNGKCTMWGSQSTGTVVRSGDDPEVCESGMIGEVVKEDLVTREYQCVEVKSEGICPQYEGGKSSITFTKSYKNDDYQCEDYYSVDGKKFYVPKYISYTTTAFKEYMDDYKSIEPYNDNFYKGEKYIGEKGGFGKYKTMVKYLKYKNAKELIGRKMIDNKGKVINSCEYEFYLKYLSSSFAKFNILISIILFVGLLL